MVVIFICRFIVFDTLISHCTTTKCLLHRLNPTSTYLIYAHKISSTEKQYDLEEKSRFLCVFLNCACLLEIFPSQKQGMKSMKSSVNVHVK